MTYEFHDRFIKTKYDAFHYVGEGETETIVQKLGLRNKAVFECIALHQNAQCISNLTQEQISKLTGIGRTTVNGAINELVDFRYEGKPIIEVIQVHEGKKPRNIYKILPNLLFSQYNEKFSCSNSEQLEDASCSNSEHTKEQVIKEQVIKELKDYEEDESMTEKKLTKKVEQKKMGKKAIVEHFIGLLKDKGNTIENFSFPKVYSIMKKKGVDEQLETLEKNNDIKRTLEIIVEEYPNWNNNKDFQLGIYTICWGWVWERAIKQMNDEKQEKENEVSRIETQSVVATKRNDVAISSIMDKIKRKKGGQ